MECAILNKRLKTAISKILIITISLLLLDAYFANIVVNPRALTIPNISDMYPHTNKRIIWILDISERYI